MTEYFTERETDFNGKESKMREDFQTEIAAIKKYFTERISKVEAEKVSLAAQVQRQAKPFRNAVAIRARTLLEKTLRGMGLQPKNEYTVDAQMRTVQQLQQHQTTQQKGR